MPPSAKKPQATLQADAAREALLKSIAQTEGLPALGVSISRVVKLASSDSDAVGGLAHVVLADVALTQKILRLANTVFYRNSSGTPVTTVSRAIFLLGFETVRTTALAMMLVESMSGRQGAAVRHELAVAVASSLLARELARRTQYREAEEASIAALFANTGCLLVAAHAHELHAVLQERVERGTQSPSQVAMELLGCNLEYLGESVLREWHIPESILHSLTPLRRGVLRPARTREDWIQQAVSFSGEAARLIISGAHALDDPLAAMQREALLSRYGEALDLGPEQLEELFAAVADETELLTGGGYCAESAANLHRARAAVAGTAGIAAEGEAEQPVVTEGAVAAVLAPEAEVIAPVGFPEDLLMLGSVQPVPGIAGRHPSGKPFNSRELLTAGVQDVTEMMASGRCGANEIIALVLETLYHALGCRFAAFCLLDGQAAQYRARLTFGEDHAARRAQFSFPAEGDEDVFLLALRNKADVVIQDLSRGRARELIPTWHRALFPDTASLVILPLLVRENRLGLFYADRSVCAPEGIPAEEAALIRTLKMQVVATLQAR